MQSWLLTDPRLCLLLPRCSYTTHGDEKGGAEADWHCSGALSLGPSIQGAQVGLQTTGS